MATKRKPTSKQALYSSISSHAKEIIEQLVQLSKSKNENVALGACKTLLNKTLPDVKSVEVTKSNVLDSLISNELDKLKPTQSNELDYENMSPEKKKQYGEELIEMGQALLGKGRYGKKPIRLAKNKKS